MFWSSDLKGSSAPEEINILEMNENQPIGEKKMK
jgi:hypothetical protein